MSHSINCRVTNAAGEELANMRFAVHFRESGEAKLHGLYSNFDTVEGDTPPNLLPDETTLAAQTHEAQILNLESLTAIFAARGRDATDDTIHVHRDTEDQPYVCWAGFTPTREQILTIVKTWTVFNTVNATANPPINPNEVGNPLDLIEQFKLKVELTIDENSQHC